MTLQEFLTKWTGKGIDFDGAYGDQCMDLMHQYCVEVLGITDGRVLAAPAAKDVWNTNVFGKDKFEAFPNTPTGVPQAGDIILFGTEVGAYGHVAIVITADVNTVTTFDQNWNGHSYCERVTHKYGNGQGVLGWLRYKAVSTTPDALEACLSQHNVLVDLCNQKDETIKQLTTTNQTDQDKIKDLEGKVTVLEDENTKLKQNVKESSDQASSLADEVKKIKDADSAAVDAGLNAETSLKALQSDMTQVYSALGISTTATVNDALRAVDDLKTHNEQTVKEYQKLYDLFFSVGAEITQKLPKTASLFRKIINLVKGGK